MTPVEANSLHDLPSGGWLLEILFILQILLILSKNVFVFALVRFQ